MKRTLCCFVLLLGIGSATMLSAQASEQGCISSKGKAKGCGITLISMPEASAILELALCAGAVGLLGWRRKSSLKAS